MARSLNGNYLGQAARIAYREQQEQINEAKRKFNEDFSAALDNLKALDPDWETWYDNQPEQTCGEMLPVMQDRVKLLRDQVDEQDHQAEKDYAHTCGYPI